MAFTSAITIDAPNASRNKNACDKFPNRRELTPFFADVDAFDGYDEALKRDVGASFFSSFERRFEEAVARLFRLNSPRVWFSRFGFSKKAPDEERLALLQSEDSSFIFTASHGTFLLFLCASLGFDVERICQDETLWRDLTSGQSAKFTELEQVALNKASSRLGALFPSDYEREDSNWRGEFFERSTREAFEAFDSASFYWEERVLESGAKKFPFRLYFPFSNFLGKKALFPIELDATSSTCRPDESERVEFAVEIAKGAIDAQRWKSLKPGDVLTTEVPADALFTALFDGKPTFKARPGVFRGVTSVQLKEPVGE